VNFDLEFLSYEKLILTEHLAILTRKHPVSVCIKLSLLV